MRARPCYVGGKKPETLSKTVHYAGSGPARQGKTKGGKRKKAPTNPIGATKGPYPTFLGVGEEGIGAQPPTLKGVQRREPW